MGIEYYGYLAVQSKDGEWKVYERGDIGCPIGLLRECDYFDSYIGRRFHASTLASIIRFPSDPYDSKQTKWIRNPDYVDRYTEGQVYQGPKEWECFSGMRYVFRIHFGRLYGIFHANWKATCNKWKLEPGDFHEFRLLILEMKMRKDIGDIQDIQMIVATNFT
jgi:hypothetical protein